ncbi:HD domain-containing protein [Paenibacillus chitinolyticus]|uniref:HD domain-containing protein n=1 Tax=Paenibacillus chitinolyticus TaxID=79263 RepID=UPI002DB9489C|nr:HD domain-containing protein [Paenibacillus chitinolyticus]MEC0247965.1 HD domain-containing protein [Paenibacillus chitinolyticus]
MRISDPIYGEFVVDGLLEELVLSQPVQRLKGVYQGGASYLVNDKWDVTRYEHSVGVMLLIRQLGGSLEEQIAGLLHDVSHTAFSHVVDYALDNREENYHENIYEQFIEESEIPQLLKKYGYTYRNLLLEDAKWTLLEQPAPALCADRVDYTMRDQFHDGKITTEEIVFFLENLTAADGKMVLTRIESAEWFVKTYYREVIDFFMHPLNAYSCHFLAEVLKTALAKKVITLSSLLLTDQEVLSLIHATDEPDIQRLLKHLHRNVQVKEDVNDYDLHRTNKIRLIDPDVMRGNKLWKASELSENVQKWGEEARRKSERGIYVKIVSAEMPSR